MTRTALWMGVIGVLATTGIARAQADAAPEEIRPFKVHVDDSVLEDLQHRLARTRLPDQIEGAG